MFNPKHSNVTQEHIDIPCGRCIQCRINRASQWALRCEHELKFHRQSMFLTLTYNDDYVPMEYRSSPSNAKEEIITRSHHTLDKRHPQEFMHKLRAHARYQWKKACEEISEESRRPPPPKIRYLLAGEYGEEAYGHEKLGRPHYHAIIFGYAFPDLKPLKKSPSGEIIHSSSQLEKLWPYGFSSIGGVTQKSAGYVARYCMKKWYGDGAEDYYRRFDPHTGESFPIQPEFQVASNRPGIGVPWLERYWKDCEKGYITNGDGKKIPVPPFYEKWILQNKHAFKMMDTIEERRQKYDPDHPDNGRDRMSTRAEALALKAARLTRKLK